MKTWYVILIAAIAALSGPVFSMATASGPQRPMVQAIATLDATGNGSARGVWIVAADGSVKYCTAAKTSGPLPAPACSPWNTTVRYAFPTN